MALAASVARSLACCTGRPASGLILGELHEVIARSHTRGRLAVSRVQQRPIVPGSQLHPRHPTPSAAPTPCPRPAHSVSNPGLGVRHVPFLMKDNACYQPRHGVEVAEPAARRAASPSAWLRPRFRRRCCSRCPAPCAGCIRRLKRYPIAVFRLVDPRQKRTSMTSARSFNLLSHQRQFVVLDVRNRPQTRGVKLGKGWSALPGDRESLDWLELLCPTRSHRPCLVRPAPRGAVHLAHHPR